MDKGIIAAAGFSLALAGCTAMGGSFCKVMTGEDGRPLLQPSVEDVATVSDQLMIGLVTVLETGEKECGWKP